MEFYEAVLRGEPVRVDYFQHDDHPQRFPQLAEECGADGTLFEDPAFPAHITLLCRSKMPKGQVRWLRPPEIVDQPTFMANVPTRFDVNQGRLGDCWLLAGLASLVERPETRAVVLPEDNPAFDSPEYCGIFHFRLFKDGHWYDVPVDDRLPTLNGRLIYTKAEDATEFWSALLEKAYAKMHGSYDHLSGGWTAEALQDFTGGVTTTIFLERITIRACLLAVAETLATNNFLGASISESHPKRQSLVGQGLVLGHAYSVLRLEWPMAHTSNLGSHGRLPLIYLRNPWGRQGWTGPWSPDSPEWQRVTEQTRLDLNQPEDGEFWMSFEDFFQNFSILEVCCFDYPLTQHGLFEDFDLGRRWKVLSVDGSWVKGESAGGPLKTPELFLTNPRHRFEVEGRLKRKVTVCLLLKDTRHARWCWPEEQPAALGFSMFQIGGPDGVEDLTAQWIANHPPRMRCVPGRCKERSIKVNLDPGTYLVVPHLNTPDRSGDYHLRVFVNESAAPFRLTKKVKRQVKNYVERLPRPWWWQRLFSTPRATAVRLNRSPEWNPECIEEGEEKDEESNGICEGNERLEERKRKREKSEEDEEDVEKRCRRQS